MLLNQVHKIHSIKNVEFLRENENDVLNSIRTFGRFNINYNNIANDFIHNEDYICPNDDHDFMYKEITNNHNDKLKICEKKEKVIDFSHNKTNLEENANNINDSIINITINESKELIDKTNYDHHEKQPSNEIYYDNEMNGVTTNTEAQDNITQQKPNVHSVVGPSHNQENTDTSQNINLISHTSITYKSRNSDRLHNIALQSKKIPIITSEEFLNKATHHDDIECEFYKRLLTETKLINNNKTTKSVIHHIYHELPTSSKIDGNSSSIGADKKIKNSIECGNTIIYDQPIQVQQWLKQIIYEADTEPLQNIEILEHSHIDVN